MDRCDLAVRLVVVACSAMALVMGSEATSRAEEKKRPNLILIMCDDLGYEGFSAYGSLSYQTPHLDRIAKTGMLFKHCYSQPICTPSRVQIMTGKYNFRNYTRFGNLSKRQITFGAIMQRAGYATAIAGKWQLGGDAETVKAFGFQKHCLWHIGGRDSRYWNPRIVENGELRAGLEDKFGPDIMCEFVTDFIRQRRDEPFFVYYPMLLPHWPFVPTPDSAPGGSRQPSGDYDGKQGGVEYFPDMVAYVDKIVGRIVDTLDREGLRENTLLLLTCDNGCATNLVSKMPRRLVHGGKGTMPDAGTHVGLFANWKGTIAPGRTSDALVDFTDILPTLADAGGAELPNPRAIDGRSFLPQLLGQAGNPRDWVFCHYVRNGIKKEPVDPEKRQALLRNQAKQRKAKTMGRFARNQRFKLYDSGMFYDVSSDVLERDSIEQGTGDQAAEAARTMLQKALDSMPPWRPYQPLPKTGAALPSP